MALSYTFHFCNDLPVSSLSLACQSVTIKFLISKRDLDGLIKMRDGPEVQLAEGERECVFAFFTFLPPLLKNNASCILSTALHVYCQAETASQFSIGPAAGMSREAKSNRAADPHASPKSPTQSADPHGSPKSPTQSLGLCYLIKA